MCRIIGQLGTTLSTEVLQAAANRQRAGGPDGQYLISAPGWALGANRLAVTDLLGGRQPYSLGGVHVVFNGEIYNHRELRARLDGLGYRFPDVCDGSILPALYVEYGERFTDHLDGMYAIAVVDLRAEPTLLLTVDHAGMKPLYHHCHEGVLTFASEPAALLALPGVRPDPRPDGLERYLATKTVFGARTMYAHIDVLEPGTTLTFRAGGVPTIRQRQQDPTPAGGPTTLAEAGWAVQEELRRQVRALSVADVPIAAVLSGGLDSSLVSALLRESVPELHTFTVAYAGDWPFDERRYATAAAEHIGSVHHTVTVDPADLPGLIQQSVTRMGQPNADPITVSTLALFQAVRESGFPVALTGDGADEVFLGYRRMSEAWSTDGDWRGPYRDALAAITTAGRDALYTGDFLEGVRATRGDVLPTGSRVAAVTGLEVGRRLPAYHLRRVDHLAMAHGVEARLPFCQRALQQTALALPEELRIAGTDVKRALRAAATELVPDIVLNRPKQPFTLPVTSMLSPGSALLSYSFDVLSPSALRRGGQLRPEAVQRLLRRQIVRPNDADAAAIWALVVYQTWVDDVMPALTRQEVSA
ncbi:asparagine synthase (glutamine-hydrolyzing) [Actinoplanes sp. CA-252034]|uniref:asparagine synthase (glutamine-hydrolyzing) n=1 Tax=Actinoplanes sp. CA-252034 TaxID=3239906 RepID=UPI003D96134D